jgi:hypothetical protein
VIDLRHKRGREKGKQMFQVMGSDRRGTYNANAMSARGGYATREAAEEWVAKLLASKPSGNYWIEKDGKRI